MDSMLWDLLDGGMVGKRISLVLVCVEGGEKTWWKNPSSGQLFKVDAEAVVGAVVSYYFWQVSNVSSAGVVRLSSVAESRQVVHQIKKEFELSGAIELCAGLGGTSFGAAFAGCKVRAAMDHSDLAVENLRLNQHPCVIAGDAGDKVSWLEIHEAIQGEQCGLLAGFPCQPFGVLGAHAAFADPRAQTFYDVLDFSYMIQANFIVLECVVGAGDNETIKSALDRYCKLRGFHWRSCKLRLQNIWPCRRYRWWCVLWPLEIELPALRDLPRLPQQPVVGDLIQEWPCWALREEIELQLKPLEEEFFNDPRFGPTDRELQLTACCPTLLHSMGHQLYDCPCQCRGPLSVRLLESQGLHAVTVKSAWEVLKKRHLHPKEAALLLGLPGDWRYQKHVRHSLPLLGQIASPIQSCWIFAIMNEKVDSSAPVPEDVLQSYLKHVIATHMRQWPTQKMQLSRTLYLHEQDEDAVMQVEVCGPVQAHEILDAHKDLTRNSELEVVCAATGILHPEEFVRQQHVWLLPRFWGAGPENQQIDMVAVQPTGLDDYTMMVQGQRLLEGIVDKKIVFWSPRETAILLGISPIGAKEFIVHRHLGNGTLHAGFLWVNGHWLAFLIRLLENGTLMAEFFDGLKQKVCQEMIDLASLFEIVLQAKQCDLSIKTSVKQNGGQHCGTVALFNLGHALGKWQKAAEESDLITLHKILLHHQNRVGHGPEHHDLAVKSLAELLEQKGVPNGRSMERAKTAIKKLGLFSVQKAMSQSDPWRSLKTLGSHQAKPFQFVLYDELQATLDTKVASKSGNARDGKKKRGSDKVHEPTLALVPDDLELLPNTFADEEGTVVPVIDLRGLQADARGIAIVTPDVALQLAQEEKNMSVDALAVLTIGDHTEAMKSRVSSTLQWSAIHRKTLEPVLITGTMLQLGDQPIHKVVQNMAPQMPSFDTVVIRIQVFHDSFTEGWEEFLRGPVKKIVHLVAPLQFCDDPSCKNKCQRFHPSVEENVSTAVLDVWNWHWSDTAGRKCKVNHAECFSVHLRLPASGLAAILAHSGWHGIFFEPRPLPGMKSMYSVIWLQKHATFEDALKHQRTIEKVIGVARMGYKIGLRVLAKDEVMVMKIVYPTSQIKPCAVNYIFELGPLPFGISRDKVAELLGKWSWEARPLRATRSTYQGKFWEVGAAVKPSSLILPTADGEVTLSLKRTQTEPERLIKCVQASSKTLNLMHQNGEKSSSSTENKGADAWMNGADPWSAYKSKVAPVANMVFPENRQKPNTETQNKFQQLQLQVETLAEQLKTKETGDEDMKIEEGTVAMEIQELKAQQGKYEQWFHSAGSRMSNIEGHLQKQANQIQELGAAVTSQAGATTQLQQQMEGLQGDLKTTLDQQFAAQNARLEALLEKKARTS